jgi:hypothetical protein
MTKFPARVQFAPTGQRNGNEAISWFSSENGNAIWFLGSRYRFSFSIQPAIWLPKIQNVPLPIFQTKGASDWLRSCRIQNDTIPSCLGRSPAMAIS